jgi:hypothetical protein|tara:strand:- start:2907 stop:3203 length:297 start_codon:yes stop_codon:yes gene_type:complete
MKRYERTGIKLDKSGLRVYSTTLYPEMPIENSDKFIHTKVGDRLDTLAHKHYGDTSLWWILSKANGIKGKIALKPAVLLRIPGDVMSIIEKFEDLNQS